MEMLIGGIILILIVDHFYAKCQRNPYGTWG